MSAIQSSAAMTPQEFELLTQSDLAAISGQSEVTIGRWRRQGAGPAFLKLGRKVMYRRVDVEAWLNQQRVGSTAEHKMRRAS